MAFAMNNLAVTVVVAAYNHERFIEQALDSVAAQTFRDFQFLIFDDCSTDRTVDRVNAWLARNNLPVTFVANKVNRGICAVWNQARALASTPLMCVLAGDDWFESDRLFRQVSAISAQPATVGFVYSDVRLVDDDGIAYPIAYLDFTLGATPRPQGRIFDRMLRENFVPAPGVLVRCAALDAIGGLDEDLAFEDDDMWLRICDRYEVIFAPGIVANKRGLASSLGISSAWSARIECSRLSIDLKWLGQDASRDRLLSMRILARASQVMPMGRPDARHAISEVARRSRFPMGRALARIMQIPGMWRVMALVVGIRRRAIRRHPSTTSVTH